MSYPIIQKQLYLYIIILLLLCSCTGTNEFPILNQLNPLPAGGVCRIAVLPFVNNSDFAGGETIFYRVFTGELTSSGNYEVVQEGDVRQILRQLKINPISKSPNFEELRIIGDYLSTDILITGTLIEMTEQGIPSKPFMSVYLQVYDAKSGQTIWSTYHSREGEEYRKVMHFGMVYMATQLSRQISLEILERWREKGFTTTCKE